jgi:hypothetical protein
MLSVLHDVLLFLDHSTSLNELRSELIVRPIMLRGTLSMHIALQLWRHLFVVHSLLLFPFMFKQLVYWSK